MTGAASAGDAAGPPDVWHGHPRAVAAGSARELVRVLDLLWRAQSDAVSARTEQQALDGWFDPVARGGRLRGALDALPAAADLADGPVSLGEPFLTDAGDGRRLVTPEGRELCRLLGRAAERAGDVQTVRLSWADTDAADRRVYETYRRWALGRLSSVVGLRQGEAPPLLPQGVGLVLLLLLNGNVGPGRALPRPELAADLRAVDEAVAAITGAFADALVPSRPRRGRSDGAYSLYGGYAMSEARRRLGSDLTRDPVCLAAGSEDRTVARLADELRRHPRVDADRVDAAMAALVAAYERWRPVLASYGLAQGRTSAADALTRRLAKAYRL